MHAAVSQNQFNKIISSDFIANDMLKTRTQGMLLSLIGQAART